MHRLARRRSLGALAVTTAALLVSACSDDASPPGDAVPVTTAGAPATTISAPTSTTSPPTTTGAVGAVGATWPPPCRDTPRAATRVDVTRTFPTFGPLADRPAITITLPRLPNHPQNGPRPDGLGDPAAVSATSVTGGVVLTLGPSSSSSESSSMIALVEHGGAVRWTRCLTGRVSGAWAAPGASRVLVTTADYTDRPRYTMQWLSTADGRSIDDARSAAAQVLGITTDAASLTVVASTETTVLLAPDDHDDLDPLLRLDLATGAMTAVQSMPGVRVSTHGDAGAPDCRDRTYALSPSGDPAVLNGIRDGGGAVTSIWANGGWNPATTAQRDSFGTRVAFCAADSRARGYAPDGTLRWTATLPRPGLEGPLVAIGEDVVVMAVCRNADPAALGNCDPTTIAVDRTTGAELWRSATLRFLPAGTADGYVLVSGVVMLPGFIDPDQGWELLDARTGTPVPDQRWTGLGTFHQGCCGDAELYRVQRLGGVVVVVADTEVRVWYPRSAVVTTPVTRTLPPA